MLRYDRQIKRGLSQLVRYPTRKQSGSILTTPEPTRGYVTSTLKISEMTNTEFSEFMHHPMYHLLQLQLLPQL